MIRDIDLTLTPQEAFEEKTISKRASSKCGIANGKVSGIKILRKSIDARRSDIKINLRVRLLLKRGRELKPREIRKIRKMRRFPQRLHLN